MKIISLLPVSVFLIPAFAFSQIAPDKYFVAFTDKLNNPYSVSSPSAFLSVRAMQRRSNQSISIDMTDLPVTPSYIDSVIAHGAAVLNKTKWLNGVIIQTTDTNVLNSIEALPFVSGIKSMLPRGNVLPKSVHHRDKFENINLVKSPTAVSANPSDYGGAWNQLAMLHGDFLHDNGYTGTGKWIAVLDAGFQGADTIPAFAALHAANRVIAVRDFVDGDTIVYDHHGHGTAVLSCMAADVAGTMIGTAPGASYILLRTEDAATEYIIEEYNWACGAEFADSAGADVINSSLGYTTFDNPLYDHTYADMNGDSAISTIAADMAASKGILVVNSAGNSGGSPWHFIGAPADGDSILAIGAVDSAGVIAAFSSRGPSSDGRVKPNVCAQGSDSFVSFASGSYGYGSGTSFASPILAGAAACFWQSCPAYNNMQIRHAIQASASLYFNPDTVYGYGIPDFQLACIILKNLYPLSEDDIIALYPNPFSESCLVQFYTSNSESIHAEVFDIIGKRVLNKTFSVQGQSLFNFTISSTDLPARGAYIIRITTNEKTVVRKIIRD